jgi:hypothetical protein
MNNLNKQNHDKVLSSVVLDKLHQQNHSKEFSPVLDELKASPPKENFPGGIDYLEAKARFEHGTY